MSAEFDFTIPVLGKCTVRSPLHLSKAASDYVSNYVADDKYIIYDVQISGEERQRSYLTQELMQRAGPREMIYFDPAKVRAAIVTCGGLCPGLNDVIRAIVMGLWYQYGVRRISGIRFGFRGFLSQYNLPVLEMTPDLVEDIHRMGGTMLGSSRGSGESTGDIVDSMERMNINMLFVIGGDGSQKGALAIAEETKKRNLKIAVVGIPKTIDNDLSFVQRSFGFETAVSHAVEAVSAAHVEAHDAVNGVGLVKVMGRGAGFIAAHTALSMNDVNFVLIPEVPFDMQGPNGLLAHLEKRLERRNHAVILTAEGAGQDLVGQSGDVDESGNKKLGDVGAFLRKSISEYFKQKGRDINLKYIDPSYIIRSAPANAGDALYCTRLGSDAVHAAMAGKTGILISLVHDHFVHVPIGLATSKKNRLDPEGSLWRDVVDATGQPPLMKN